MATMERKQKVFSLFKVFCEFKDYPQKTQPP